jgi:hypothetical protein
MAKKKTNKKKTTKPKKAEVGKQRESPSDSPNRVTIVARRITANDAGWRH